MKINTRNLVACALTGCSLATMPAVAANWSQTQLHVNYGDFKNPFSGQKADTSVVSLQHASAYDYGDNFFFIDVIHDDLDDGYQDSDFYGEWYSNFSLSKISGENISAGPLKDVGFVMGFNAAGDAKVLKYLPGVKLDWQVDGFDFFSTLVTAYIDDSDGVSAGGAPTESDSWMLDIAWGAPFSLGEQKFYFTGHVEYIDGRTNEFGEKVQNWVLAQPILQWDLGHALNAKERTLMLGIEWQYWHNKLGTNTSESVPQIHLAWTF
ncbi:nucleoside-binding outer membrane protein [Pseudoalteromonas sp. SW0106-04]|uniref:nucleoside-binding protein n=1 Tax=Pseudoalteromonas sp. SW0106-04 TaxID=1702169 RepID=UPI0006B46973|nr:nucleoside-binding protein [Pseudoalteromonas sp. SW0106-04]GAP76600.1 nucleoside-binding outer membrane protein [Pseudoalteromonas sp. SW0106-04]